MKKNLLAIFALACSMTSAFAGTDAFLEHNCMGLSEPSTEAPVVSAAAAKSPLIAVLKKNNSPAALSMASRVVPRAVGALASADKAGLMVKASCNASNGKC
jgi:hypothetical protein